MRCENGLYTWFLPKSTLRGTIIAILQIFFRFDHIVYESDQKWLCNHFYCLIAADFHPPALIRSLHSASWFCTLVLIAN